MSQKELFPRENSLSDMDARLLKQRALIDELDDDFPIVFQHSVLCQTVMPYDEPGKDVRRWERKQGNASLLLEAGVMWDGVSYVNQGLPYGPKARLALYHLNSEALKTGSPYIELERSLTSFVKRLGLSNSGQNIATVKDQLIRLAAASYYIGYNKPDSVASTAKAQIVSGFDIVMKSGQMDIDWPKLIEFSPTYFQSLMEHAIPLNESAIIGLSNSAMAMDVYAWLAQRLHRIPPGQKGQFIGWKQLHDQFGGYRRIGDFRRHFVERLKRVSAVYPDAKLDIEGIKGLRLLHSPPPIPKRIFAIK